jgi:sugar phosphate isomerase/epimerase
VMENHYKDPFWNYPEFAQRIDVFTAVIRQIDSPYFGVQFDPSNCIVAGEDPLVLLDKVSSRVRTMHASDRYLAPGVELEELKQSDGTIGYSPSLLHGVIGKGLNDYDTIMRTLRTAGFSGWISIEDGMNGLEEIRESALFLRSKMQEHGLSQG